jgi:hypothetical protein
MNQLAILFQAALPSIPVCVLFVPIVIYVLWTQAKPYPKYCLVSIICGLAVPLVGAVIGYAFCDSRSDFMFTVLEGLLILDAVIFALSRRVLFVVMFLYFVAIGFGICMEAMRARYGPPPRKQTV